MQVDVVGLVRDVTERRALLLSRRLPQKFERNVRVRRKDDVVKLLGRLPATVTSMPPPERLTLWTAELTRTSSSAATTASTYARGAP